MFRRLHQKESNSETKAAKVFQTNLQLIERWEQIFYFTLRKKIDPLLCVSNLEKKQFKINICVIKQNFLLITLIWVVRLTYLLLLLVITKG